MAENLRWVLILISAVVIGGLLVHGLWSVRKRSQAVENKPAKAKPQPKAEPHEPHNTQDTVSRSEPEPTSVQHDEPSFGAIDDEPSIGEINIDEFFDHFGLEWSRFAERAFMVMEVSGDHKLSFAEFTVGLMNYCTCTHDGIIRLAFDLFDDDHSGHIDRLEMKKLLKKCPRCFLKLYWQKSLTKNHYES